MRQLILCCDGTNNNFTGGVADTHLVRLRELLAAHNDADQRIFYDPGVGNAGMLPAATIGSKLRGLSERIAGLAFGRGVYENIAEGYRYLMREYKPGDQIFIFGFSRGAFTARSIAGLVNKFGVLRPEASTMVRTLLHLYFADDAKVDRSDARQSKPEVLVAQIQRTFGQGEVPVHFVGVWDTVGSVGMWPFGLKFTAKPTLAGKRFIHVRQALALDEQRAEFKPRLYAEENGSFDCAPGFGTGTLQQLWFRGSHCDVGGGYARADATLSMAPLCWMLSEACQLGLRLSANGQVLLTEEAVGTALHDHQPALDSGNAPPLIHSQLQQTPLWAITGLAVRVTDRVDLDAAEDPHVTPVEHPSVAAWPARFPQDTAWARWNLGQADLLALLVAVLCPVLMVLCSGLQGAHEFVAWQLGWVRHGWVVRWPDGVDHLMWQLLLDVPFILAWSWLLSIPAVWAFARRAGLRRVQSRVPKGLQTLGWSLTLAVFADLGEDLFSVLTLGVLSFGHDWMATLPAALMSICSIGKWAGVAGTLLLIASGFLPARRSS